MTTAFLNSQKLELRKISTGDRELFHRTYGDPNMMRHLGGAATPEAIEEKLRDAIAHWQTHGFGTCAAFLRETGEAVGTVSLIYNVEEGDKTFLDLGWMISENFQGKGLASEAARAYLEFAGYHLKADEVFAFPSPENLASCRVAEKLGFVPQGLVRYPYLGKVLELKRYIWRRQNPPRNDCPTRSGW